MEYKSVNKDAMSTAKTLLADDNRSFAEALARIATADAASSRAAIEASKATKPSLHTRFVHNPAKDRA